MSNPYGLSDKEFEDALEVARALLAQAPPMSAEVREANERQFGLSSRPTSPKSTAA